ncbi:MAG: flagellar basal body rod protein FlgC [Elusimicrobia bacterium]|jgi:flagellar basal-body rod protein FlgC|nr:flagellar basal body rod protein FlgC [Elusimicrobiota bacterium]
MGAFDGLTISGSGMTAHRAWMETAASNVANANTTRTAAGGPYQRKTVVFEETLRAAEIGAAQAPSGVNVTAGVPDPTPFPRLYDPSHPDADPQGYVRLPNVDPVREMVDLTAATRGYEANVSAFGATKSMLLKSLEIGK